MTKKVYKYIVLVSIGIGGAEKRFLDIFRSLVIDHDDVFLVVSASLYKKLPITSNKNIIVIGKADDDLMKFVVNYYTWLKKLENVEASFHYPVNCLFFLHFFKPHRVTMSLTNCYFAPTLITFKRSLVRQYLSLFFVSHVDVLNPNIYEEISRFRFTNFTLTPNGTYVYPEHDKPLIKKPLYGFIGRLIPGKGIEGFLEKLPEIWNLLQPDISPDFSFFIAGYGPLEKLVQKEVSKLHDLGIPVFFYGYKPAEELLEEAQLIFSLQEKTNYPSRVVAEAMINGCSVLVTDTGDSRSFGDFEFGLDYISPKLISLEIVNLIKEVENRYKNNLDYALKVKDEGLKKFSSKTVISYFLNILINEKR